MHSFTYRIGAALPDLWLFWKDSNKDLIDFSTGWTFEVALAVRETTDAVLVKTTGIEGAVGSEVDHLPNVIVSWVGSGGSVTPGASATPGDFDNLEEGTYDFQLKAIAEDYRVRYWPSDEPIRIILVAPIAEAGPGP